MSCSFTRFAIKAFVRAYNTSELVSPVTPTRRNTRSATRHFNENECMSFKPTRLGNVSEQPSIFSESSFCREIRRFACLALPFLGLPSRAASAGISVSTIFSVPSS
jgi:hypothetical protein